MPPLVYLRMPSRGYRPGVVKGMTTSLAVWMSHRRQCIVSEVTSYSNGWRSHELPVIEVGTKVDVSAHTFSGF